MRGFAASMRRKQRSLRAYARVLTRDNLNVASNAFGAYVRDQQILATVKVRYAGDMVAAVAATDDRIAREAIQLIDVEYDELPAVYTVEDALKDGAPLVHENPEAPKDPQIRPGRDSHRARKDQYLPSLPPSARRRRRGVSQIGFCFRRYVLFSERAALSRWSLTAAWRSSTAKFSSVWTSTQSPFPVRQELARVFGFRSARCA